VLLEGLARRWSVDELSGSGDENIGVGFAWLVDDRHVDGLFEIEHRAHGGADRKLAEGRGVEPSKERAQASEGRRQKVDGSGGMRHARRQ
jgi:hypothetical protein